MTLKFRSVNSDWFLKSSNVSYQILYAVEKIYAETQKGSQLINIYFIEKV